VNLDLNHVQAFVAAADALHFGRAARQLHLTQQGLSHRITRLEQVLGERLFVRDARTVELTPAGLRFLPHARQLLAAADAAVAETRSARTPLRIDVWGQLHAPLRWMAQLSAIDRQIPLDISMRRNAPAAIDALDRGEIDAVFCPSPSRPVPRRLDHTLIGLEPHGAAIPPGHRLAGRSTVSASDLRGLTLWSPGTGTDPEVMARARQLAARYDMCLDDSGNNLGLNNVLAGLASRPDRLMVLPLAIDPQMVPITDPTPYCAWTMVWRPGNRDEELVLLGAALSRVAAADGPAEWDAATCWLPPAGMAYLPRRSTVDGDEAGPRQLRP
jgi:DNA-binding transcriptional LysR family regulator